MGLHEKMAAAIGPLQGIRCEVCDKRRPISLAQATVMLRTGWPTCCGRTMRLHTKNDPMPPPRKVAG